MDAELKSKWVAALRSGEFKQGNTYLYKPDRDEYCCLGVLCVIGGVSKGRLADRCTTNIPWIDSGLDDKTRSLLGDDMNDRERKTFPEIADYIESEL